MGFLKACIMIIEFLKQFNQKFLGVFDALPHHKQKKVWFDWDSQIKKTWIDLDLLWLILK